ncbi:MAG: V-type synthase subunit [Clostridiaceae bacterium]|jgi:V/A-type H+-transporting ATPase subunit C|nr:V-type synthase subunit [Clostridiaceae bacterium]
MGNEKYAQAVSRIRAIETKLFDESMLNRMIESSSPEEALKILQETEYANQMQNIKNVQDYETILSNELKKLYDLLYNVVPNKALVDIMELKYDYHNIKTLLKGKALNKDYNYLLIKVKPDYTEKIKLSILKDNYSDIPKIMAEAIQSANSEFLITKDPQAIDIIIDNYMFKHILAKAETFDESFVKNFVKLNIDLTNIKALLRIKNQNRSREFLNSVLIAGGKVDKDILLNCLNESIETIINKLMFTDYGNILRMGLEEYIKDKKLNKFEKLCDNYTMDYLKSSRYISFGPEPILAYIFGKENEIKTIRIIMVGKINKVSPNVIRERLREVYV